MKPVPPIRLGDTTPQPSPPRQGPPALTLPTPAAPRKVPAASAEGSQSSQKRSQSRRGPAGWIETATHPRACWAVVGVSIALLGFSARVGSDLAGHPRPSPRSAEVRPPNTGSDPEPSALDALRLDANHARSRLIGSRRELNSLLERIEGDAERRGWHVQLTLSPPIPSPGGVAELVTYPAVLQLSPSIPGKPPGFGALVEWLEGISALPRRAEVTGLTLSGHGPRRGSARVELQVLGKKANEETAPE